MDDWHTIDTAPMDGTLVLVCYRHKGRWVYRLAVGEWRCDPDAPSLRHGFGRWLSYPGGQHITPIHWQPLIPPQAREIEGE